MTTFLQVLFDGAAQGAIYGAIALALVLVYRSTGVVNFAQGEIALASTYLVWQFTSWGVPVFAAMLISVVVSFALGVLVQTVVIRRVPGESPLAMIVVTLGVMVAVNSLVTYVWGTMLKSMQDPFPAGRWVVAGVRLNYSAVGTLAVILAVLSVLYVLITRTRMGLAARAAASNPESAQLSGIDVRMTALVTWGLAASTGAVAGALAGPRLFLEPNLMLYLLIYALAAATLGGFDNPAGAIVGGLIVGVAEGVGSTYVDFIGSDLKMAVPFALIFVVLMVRPSGLFGTTKVVRV